MTATRRLRGGAQAFALALALAACSAEPGPGPAAAAPSVRFDCAEGCGSYKTVRAGETPPPCCGGAMERQADPPGH